MTEDSLQLADDEARIDALLRSMTVDDLELSAPPASLWDEIEAAVLTSISSDSVGEESGESAPNNVVDITSRFRRGTAFFAAAAAAVVMIVGAVVVAASSSDDPAYEVVGEADLGWQDGFVAEGVTVSVDAAILDDGSGSVQAVRLDDASLPTRADEDLELWLIGVDDAGELTIQTLGLIEGAGGTFDVPDEFDSSAFETVLVDISYEPRDGVEAHSGASIVRGEILDA
ncbi:MAG: anti-sigma factor [Actinomycetota bacterium]